MGNQHGRTERFPRERLRLNVVKGLLRLSTAWIGTMPNTLRVAMNLAHAVKRNSMHLSLNINELKRLRAILRKRDFLKRDQNSAILGAIVIAQLEIPFGEFRIPPDAIQQFVYRYHSPSRRAQEFSVSRLSKPAATRVLRLRPPLPYLDRLAGEF